MSVHNLASVDSEPRSNAFLTKYLNRRVLAEGLLELELNDVCQQFG